MASKNNICIAELVRNSGHMVVRGTLKDETHKLTYMCGDIRGLGTVIYLCASIRHNCTHTLRVFGLYHLQVFISATARMRDLVKKLDAIYEH